MPYLFGLGGQSRYLFRWEAKIWAEEIGTASETPQGQWLQSDRLLVLSGQTAEPASQCMSVQLMKTEIFNETKLSILFFLRHKD